MVCMCDIRIVDKLLCSCLVFFFQAEDGIRDLVRSRGLGDVYKRQGDRPKGAARRRRDAVGSRAGAGLAAAALAAVLVLSLIHI